MKFLPLYILSISLFASESVTLERAWELTKENNLRINGQHFDTQLQQQQFLELEKQQDIQTSVNIKLEQKDRYNDRIDNSSGYLLIKKNLYSDDLNFLKDNAQRDITLSNQQLAITTQQQKIELLHIFFDTLLSDFNYQYNIENVAVMAVKNNHTQDDFDLGSVSDVEILQTQSDLQLALSGLKRAESSLILNSKRLTHITGVAKDFDRVVTPNLDEYLLKKVPETANVLKKLDNNLELVRLRSELQNLKDQLIGVSNNGVTIDIYSKIYKQAFETNKNGNYLFGVDFSMPIGASDDSEMLTIKIAQMQNNIALTRQQLQNDVLAQILELHNLKQLRKALKAKLEYRDFYLERARAKYEMELKSDIGDSMAQYTKTEYLLAKNKFDIVLAWHALALLLGEEYEI